VGWSKAEKWGAGIGGAAVAALVGVLALRPKALTVTAGAMTPTSATATNAGGGQTVGGITSQTARAPSGSRRLKAIPTSQSGAPGVTGLTLVSFTGGVAVLKWTGGPATWNGADNTGYNLYVQRSGNWTVVGVEVEPPLSVSGLSSGDIVGIAPTYLTPGGQEVAGQVSGVKIP
jgi:hypothetical protein